MLNCVKHGVLHFAEHTENDGIYGDNSDGTGLNQLGKVHNNRGVHCRGQGARMD